MNALIKKLGIDETLTKQQKKQKEFNHIKNNIPRIADYNYMSDLLALPETKKGFKYLLVVVDLATDAFDIEPLKKKEPAEVLDAFKKITKRKYLKIPYASIRTDGGSEFKGVFHKWLLSEGVLHKLALPNRHKQMANVEALNKQLGRIFNGYMNQKEIKIGKTYKEWDDIIKLVRTDLNEYRKKKMFRELEDQPKFSLVKAGKAKYKIGDMVYNKLDWAEDALGKKQPTPQFREGDYRYSQKPQKIVKVLYMNDKPYYRYLLDGIPNASYSENELILSKNDK